MSELWTAHQQKKIRDNALGASVHRVPAEKGEGRAGRERNREGKRNSLGSAFGFFKNKGIKLIELLLFPSFCRLCHRLLDQVGERIICQSCWQQIRPLTPPYCSRCGRYFEIELGQKLCADCQQEKWSFSLHRSATRYEGRIKEIIVLFKYGRIKLLGKDIARLALSFLTENEFWDGLDLIIPVPLSSRRKRERGFNQAEILAKHISFAKGIPLASQAMVKVKENLPQACLEGRARRDNVKGVYKVERESLIRGRVILLVDDVFTTGSTIEECSLTLKKAGALEVRALTMAQA